MDAASWGQKQDGECYRLFSFETSEDKWTKSEFSFIPSKDGSINLILKGEKTMGAAGVIPVWSYVDDITVTGATIVNGDFEEGTKGWGLWKGAFFITDKTLTHNGSAGCVKVWHNENATQPITVKGGQEVKVSFWHKGAGN